MRSFILCLSILLLVSNAPAQDSSMMKADAAFVAAAANGDQTAMEGLLDADFTWITAAGKMETRAGVLRQTPKMAVASAQNPEVKAYTYGELGNVQVNLGRAHVLRVWAKRSGTWKALVYQEVTSLETPPTFTPGAGVDCDNPCKTIAFTPKTATEREVASAYSRLETAAHARNSATFGPSVGDEFAAASSNSDKVQTKRGRMAEFDRAKDGGLAPTPLLSARMFTFGDAVLMVSDHKPDRGAPLRVTRIWVKRAGQWVETVSYQTAVPNAP